MYNESVRMSANHERQIGRLETLPHLRMIADPFLALPALRGFWPMSSFDESGDAYDMSGQGRTLTNHNVAMYDFDRLVPYSYFPATTRCLGRADEAGLDIISTETYVNPKGITFGGWFNANTLPTTGSPQYYISWLIGKSGGGEEPQSGPYVLTIGYNYIAANRDKVTAHFEAPGALQARRVMSTNTITTGTWFFAVGRFVPDVEIGVFLNNVETVDATNPISSVDDSDWPLYVGGVTEGDPYYWLDGQASLCFLCAAALSDTIILSLFQRTRSLFGV